MKLGLVTYNLAKDWDVDTIIEMCTKHGFEGVEPRTTHAHGIEVDLSAEQRKEIRSKFEDSPIELAGLGSAFEYHSPDPDELRRNIEGTKDAQKAYFKQVDRMAFVTPAIRNGMKMWTTLIQALSGGIAMTVLHPPLTVDPLGTTLVSKAYSGGDPDSGKITLNEDHSKPNQAYDTMPMLKNSEYEKSLKVRGPNFMGCQDPEKLGCFDSTSSDNPFGDYVLPPETP